MLVWLRQAMFKQDNLRTTRDLLLPKLISGELDVSHLPEPEAMAA
jgi:type I restriction enzyme S subunit